MSSWNSSLFFQSLGWATLNSFWQMAVLWCCYLMLNSFFKLSASSRYKAAVFAIAAGAVWSVSSFVLFYNRAGSEASFLLNLNFLAGLPFLPVVLSAASFTYLLLFIFPAARFFKAWVFIQKLKTRALHKPDVHYRLFVQKLATQLGLKHKVAVYISGLINSPLTIGYLKPVILLPVALCNQLTVAQAEAILLHELSHIRRYDYLINFIISIIHTILYFNPFVKLFIRIIDEERETCCDNLVLQYGYDKVSYASALLSLEKLAAGGSSQELLLAAAGKRRLLNRIEKIVGVKERKTFRFNHLAGIMAALFCIFAFNSLLLITDKKDQRDTLAYNNILSPFSFTLSVNEEAPAGIVPPPSFLQPAVAKVAATPSCKKEKISNEPGPFFSSDEKTFLPEEGFSKEDPASGLMPVAFNAVDGALPAEAKDRVNHTVEVTKKVVANIQWNQVESSIGDVMTVGEKKQAKDLYLRKIEESSFWKNFENNLKTSYNSDDLYRLTTRLNNSLESIQLDSLKQSCTEVLAILNKASAESAVNGKVKAAPLPDVSVEKLNLTKEKLRQSLDTIKAIIKEKTIVHL